MVVGLFEDYLTFDAIGPPTLKGVGEGEGEGGGGGGGGTQELVNGNVT